MSGFTLRNSRLSSKVAEKLPRGEILPRLQERPCGTKPSLSMAAGYEVHVAARIKDGRAAIDKEGFVPHGLSWSRGSISPLGSFSATLELRRLFRSVNPDIVHNVALKPVLIGTVASLGRNGTAVVNSLTGLGAVFVDNGGSGRLTRKVVEFALRYLLKRARSCTVVQNPDDRRFLVDLGVPANTIAVIPGSGVDIGT